VAHQRGSASDSSVSRRSSRPARQPRKYGGTDHDGAGACFFGDASLFGIDDVHCTRVVSSGQSRKEKRPRFLRRVQTASPIRLTDDAALEHLSKPGLRNTGSRVSRCRWRVIPRSRDGRTLTAKVGRAEEDELAEAALPLVWVLAWAAMTSRV
jgi:hypothetical protein